MSTRTLKLNPGRSAYPEHIDQQIQKKMFSIMVLPVLKRKTSLFSAHIENRWSNEVNTFMYINQNHFSQRQPM